VTAAVGVASRASKTAISLGADQRRCWFYPKTDIELPDERLRDARAAAARTLEQRTATVAALAAELGLGYGAKPLAAGTFHVVHAVGRQDDYWALRSTVDDVFTEDRTLYIEAAARRWLGVGGAPVPKTHTVRVCADGAPFDFSVIERSSYPNLRDLGDAVLDEEQRWLLAMGEALARIHQCSGGGAGLLLLDNLESSGLPEGVHRTWQDFLFCNADQHVDTCQRAGLITAAEQQLIFDLIGRARPLIQSRPMRLLHGDFASHNLCVELTDKRVTHVLDWEDALVGDPLFDLAMALTFQPPRRHAALLTGYGVSKAAPEQDGLLALYYLRISLSKTVHRLRFGLTDLPGREPAHLRITRGMRDLERLL
jgi:aminoglycoside phosphotransferase (APT) family kinase protein